MTKLSISRMRYLVIFIILSFALWSCQENYMPKPYAYFRIDLPFQQYVSVDTLGPYSTEINAMCEANITDDEFATDSDEWINIEYPQLNAIIHLSYKKISREDFRIVSEESRSLAYKHTIRADAISENYYANDSLRMYGIFYEMKGNAASQAQFFMTDSVENFIRGSLYFNNKPNADSIAPVASYIQQDMIHMVETLKWKETKF